MIKNRGTLGGRSWWSLALLLLVIPAPVFGVSLIALWNRPLLAPVYDSFGMFVVAHTARFLPLAVLISSALSQAIDSWPLEAGRLENVTAWSRFRFVTLPLLRRTAALIMASCFLLSLGEIGVSLLVSPPGQALAPMLIYNLLHYGAGDLVAGISLGLLSLVGGCWYWVLRFTRNP